MNLESFPTSPMAVKMLAMVTAGFYDRSYVGKWIYQVMGLELDAAGTALGSISGQAYLPEATWALKYWEAMAGLPERADLTDERRRALVLAQLNNRRPDTPAWLSQFLTAVTGCEVIVTENPGTYTFNVFVAISDIELDIGAMLDRLAVVKPAHLSAITAATASAEQDIYFGSVMVSHTDVRIGCEVPDELIPDNANTLDAGILGSLTLS